MMWRRKSRLLTIIVVIAVAVMLIGCTKAKTELRALDQFWDTLGGKVMTKSKDE
jgi:hypothetical protein